MKLIIFDFDGVLVDTLIISYEIAKDVNKNLSLNTFRSLFNGNIYDSLKNSAEFKQHPEFFEHYEKQSRELVIPESLKDIIYKLCKSHKLAIVSATTTLIIENILKRADLFECFSDILGGDIHTSKVVKNKMLLEKCKITKTEAVYITDTVGDIIEARECGIKSIAVTWGFHDEKTLLGARPDKIVNHPEDLIKTIAEIQNGKNN